MKGYFKKYKFLFGLLSLTLILTSCNFNVKLQNSSEEKDKAELVIADFHTNYNTSKFEKNKQLFSIEFLDVVDFNELTSVLVEHKTILGNYKDKELLEWSTDESLIEDNWSAILIYMVDYENEKAREIFEVVKENGGFKIRNYQINSKAFEIEKPN